MRLLAIKTIGWISCITKSHFSSVERFWAHLRIADNLASYHGLFEHQRRFLCYFPNAERLIGFLLQLIALCYERSTGKEIEWACIFAEFSNSARTNSFHTVEVGKAVATVRKKNIQAEVKNRKMRINCQQKRCFI